MLTIGFTTMGHHHISVGKRAKFWTNNFLSVGWDEVVRDIGLRGIQI
jgi:hypothetical protein